MELAVNMFTGGMVLDSHPLVQSSDTLSDALNATYITMNGNEVVLLNDMGNRRVDNAYLPAGYEPVGIKEHGGIIYIAAYNPITHRSQIGSFPSPERNMGEEYDDYGANFLFESFVSDLNLYNKEGINFLKNDTVFIPLIKDTSLHAGDKFTIYSDYIWEKSNLITNFGVQNNIYNKTPFNSYFTLSLGILNSLNEFSDITSTLVRFNENSKILNNLDTEEKKFNTGFFIAPGNWKNKLKNDFSTSSLLTNRDKIGANTYAYKLTGPLYLKAELNHIQTFSYNIEMSKTVGVENTIITLFITGTALYNCPDGIDDNNINFFDSFKLFTKKVYESSNYLIENSITNIDKPKLESITKSPRIQDSSGNYISTITKKYTISISSNYNNNVLEYAIAVPIFHTSPFSSLLKDLFINGLSEFGSLDISKIGTNFCDLVIWKYKNNVENGVLNSTLLDYKFDCYTDQITEFKDLKIELINLTSNLAPINLGSIISFETTISSGRQLLLIDWKQVEEIKRVQFLDLYLVKISFKKYQEQHQVTDFREKVIYRFILGTQLFNSCYDEINEETYTPDFGIFMGTKSGNNYEYTEQSITTIIPITENSETLREKYLNISELFAIDSNPTITEVQNNVEKIGSNPISLTNPSINSTYSCQKFEKTININYSKLWKLINLDLYPNTLNVLNLINNTTVTIDRNDISKEVSVNLLNSNSSEYNFLDLKDTFKESIVEICPNNSQINNNKINQISFGLNLVDGIYSGSIKETRLIGKAYVDVDSTRYKDIIIDIMSRNLTYNGFTAWGNFNGDWDDSGYAGRLNGSELYNSGEWHDMHDDWQSITWTFRMFDKNPGIDPDDVYYTTWPDDFGTNLVNTFKEKTKCPFTFMLFDNPGWGLLTYSNPNEWQTWGPDNNYLVAVDNTVRTKSPSRFTRVWWINEDGTGIILNNRNNTIAQVNKAIVINGSEFSWEVTTSAADVTGLFDSGRYSTNNEDKRIAIYKDILHFIGYSYNSSRIFGENEEYKLVMPLENQYLSAWYPNPHAYLYSDYTTVNLTANIHYEIINLEGTNTPITVQNQGCLNFYVKDLHIKDTKLVNKSFIVNNTFSLGIFDLSLQADLSNFSIDLETGNIISSNDPLKHLYLRNNINENLLKEVPKNYPIQLNAGTRYDFPLTCNKRYNPQKNNVGNPFSVLYSKGEWGNNDDHWVTDDTIGAKMIVDFSNLSNHQIPVLYQEDLVINDPNFFNT